MMIMNIYVIIIAINNHQVCVCVGRCPWMTSDCPLAVSSLTSTFPTSNCVTWCRTQADIMSTPSAQDGSVYTSQVNRALSV